MQTPLNASASSAGALISNSTFEVPQFQREYSWQEDEVSEFWRDLVTNIEAESYFLGLIILTDEAQRKHVVDGQQRLITLSLLATSIYFEAQRRGRNALADRIRADFIYSIDYDSDASNPRVILSDPTDDATFQQILSKGLPPEHSPTLKPVSSRIIKSFEFLSKKLSEDLKADPFKRLGRWTEFLTHRVYFAVFVHPDPASAYQVYEVINTRGRELTTADLLKNYVLSQTAQHERQDRYDQWQRIASHFATEGNNTYVQYIRHVITVRCGHILPKDLFSFLAQRVNHQSKHPPTPNELMDSLETHLPPYAQMIDPTLAGPAEPDALSVFAALNSLGVMAVRPILLSVANVPDSVEGMKYTLRLVVRRIVVGNLGTGNVERRFGEAAKRVNEQGNWNVLVEELGDLNPSREEFAEQLRKRSFNKGVLAFLRHSILAKSITPNSDGFLHFIWTRQAPQWEGLSEKDGAFWASTIGNTFIALLDRRPKGAGDWSGFKEHVIPHGVDGEWTRDLRQIDEWNAAAIEQMGAELAQIACDVWYE